MSRDAVVRAIAKKYPEATEGLACAGTSLECTTFSRGGKAFVFVGPRTARLKLEGSLPEAAKRAAKDPGRYKVGANGWVAVSFSEGEGALFESLEDWIDESFQLLGAGAKKPAAKKKPRAKKPRAKKPAAKRKR